MASIDFDAIIIVDGHGCYNTRPSGEVRECTMVGVPSGMTATFLEAVPCGVTNFVDHGWKDRTAGYCHSILPENGPSKYFALKLQKYLKEEKNEYVSSRTDPLLKQEAKKGTVDPILIAMQKFSRVEAWEMKSYHSQYANRSYTVTTTVIYSVHSLDLRGITSRSSLLDVLMKQGINNPLIIDSTCGGVDADSPTGERHVARLAKQGEGGKRTRGKRSKRKSMKRPKV